MPRPPQPQKAKHPLKLLRQTLSTHGHFSQADLARYSGIPEQTIHAIENGQRRLTERILLRINRKMGAYWNGETWKQGWTDEPFTAEGFKQYWRATNAPPDEVERPVDVRILQGKIELLFEHCPETKWNDLIFDLQEALEEIRERLGLTKLAKCFEETEQVFLVYTSKTDGEIKALRQHPQNLTYLDIGTGRLLTKPWKLPKAAAAAARVDPQERERLARSFQAAMKRDATTKTRLRSRPGSRAGNGA